MSAPLTSHVLFRRKKKREGEDFHEQRYVIRGKPEHLKLLSNSNWEEVGDGGPSLRDIGGSSGGTKQTSGESAN